MARISKKKLSSKAQKHIDEQFVETIVALRTLSGGTHFLSELLTKTEHIILAKRLMIIFMLAEEISQYRIRKILNVSSSTVARMARLMDAGAFPHLVRVCRKQKNRKMLWQKLEIIIRFGMPSMGKDRWKWLDNY